MNSKVEVSAGTAKPPLKGCCARPTSIIRFHSRAWIPQICLLGFAVIFSGIGAAGQHSSSPQASEPIATLDGQPILEDELPGPVRIQLQKIHRQEDQLKSSGLDALLEKKLLEAEAKKKGLSVTQLVATEVDGKVPDPTAGEVNAYYLARQDQNSLPLDEVREQLQQTVKNLKIQQARGNYVKDLLEKAKASGEVVILLHPSRVQLSFDPVRLKGSPKAPVMIVEFSDFSCPYCRKAESTLGELISNYKGQVSLAYRDYPLKDVHPHAQMAAEASRCAAEQGRFWEYHDLLFSNPEKQDPDNLLLYAQVLQLDQKHFNSCLSSGQYKDKIEEDLQEGMRVGVIGTPGFFINGIFVDGAQPAAIFEHIIDEELSRK